MSAALDQVADEIAALVVEKAGEKLLAKLEERAAIARPDPLLTKPKAAAHMGITIRALSLLIEQGYIVPAPGLLEIKIRQSTLDAYGKPTVKPTK